MVCRTVDLPRPARRSVAYRVIEADDEIGPIERERRSDNGIGVVGNRVYSCSDGSIPGRKPKGSVDFVDLSLRDQITVGWQEGEKLGRSPDPKSWSIRRLTEGL